MNRHRWLRWPPAYVGGSLAAGLAPVVTPVLIAYASARLVEATQSGIALWPWAALLVAAILVGNVGWSISLLVDRYLQNYAERVVLEELRTAMVVPRYIDPFCDPTFQSNFAFAFNSAGASRAQRFMNLVQAAIGSVAFVAFLGVLWRTLPALAVILLLAVPVFAYAERFIGGALAEGSIESSPAMRAMAYLATTLGTTSVITEAQLLGTNEFLFDQLGARQCEVHTVMTRTILRQVAGQVVLSALAAIVIACALAATVTSTDNVGSIVFVVSLLPQLSGAIDSLTGPLRVDRSESAGDEALDRALDSLAHEAPTSVATTRKVVPGGSDGGLKLEGVSLLYGDQQALFDIDVNVTQGRVTGICGLNGSGKSSIINVAAGLHRPSAGQVTLNGVVVDSIGLRDFRRAVTGLAQSPVRYEATLHDNIAVGSGSPMVRRFTKDLPGVEPDSLLSVGFTVDGRPLSGGQWKRVAIDRMLNLGDFDVYVLDEPEAELDAVGRSQLALLLQELRTAGKSVLLATHNAEFLGLCDHIYELDGGRVAAAGTFDELERNDGSFVSQLVRGAGLV